MNKKGQVGLDTAKAFILLLLVIGVLGFSVVIVMSTLNDVEQVNPATTGSLANETIAFDTAGTDLSIVASSRTITLSNDVLTNATGGEILPSTNYTISGGTIFAHATSPWNGTNVNVTADYSYTTAETAAIAGNITGGVVGFFSNVGTWMSLIAIVIIILVIALVIVAVNRFGGRSAGL